MEKKLLNEGGRLKKSWRGKSGIIFRDNIRG